MNELLIFDEFVTSKSPETLHDGTVVSLYTVCSLQILKKEGKKNTPKISSHIVGVAFLC